MIGCAHSRHHQRRHVHRLGPMPAWRLALEEHLQSQSVTRIIGALERDRLIIRTRSEADRREIELSITPHGRKVLSEDIGARRAWLEKAMDGHLTPAERKTLMNASEIMLKLAHTHIEDETRTGDE